MGKKASVARARKTRGKGATVTAAHVKGTITVSAQQYSAFRKKLQRFRSTLNPTEQTLLNLLLKGPATGDTPEEASHQPGERDSVGATSLGNGKQIRDADGSITTCAEGSSVQGVDNGMGNFNWLCVSDS
jgi:hypothetical protein